MISLSERKTIRSTKTKRTSRTKRSSPTKRITPTQRTLTKNLESLDYGEGIIETDEFKQVGLSKKGRLTDKAPIEAVSGVDASKGKSLRKKGFKRVGDLRKKETASREAEAIEKIIKAQEEPQFKGTTLEEITKEVQAKEDAKIEPFRYFVFTEDKLPKEFHDETDAVNYQSSLKGESVLVLHDSLEGATIKAKERLERQERIALWWIN